MQLQPINYVQGLGKKLFATELIKPKTPVVSTIKKYLLSFYFLILPFLFNGNGFSFSEEIKINGRIISADEKKPVADAYVFIVEGEEEAITNNKGEFHITSWQKFPLTLHVRHPKYKDANIKVVKLSPLTVIELDKKR